MCAPRARAPSSGSSTRTAAPSPSTKPSRERANGREAAGPRALAVDVAPSRQKPATPSGLIIESVPPASIQSRRPLAMRRNAAPSASVPAAHALTCTSGGVRRSWRCAIACTQRSDGDCKKASRSASVPGRG